MHESERKLIWCAKLNARVAFVGESAALRKRFTAHLRGFTKSQNKIYKQKAQENLIRAISELISISKSINSLSLTYRYNTFKKSILVSW